MLRMRLLALALLCWCFDSRTLLLSGSARAAGSAPHYVLALKEKPKLCLGIQTVYNQLLSAALRKGDGSSSTNFEVSQPGAFKIAGLTVPPVVKRPSFDNPPLLDSLTFYRALVDHGTRQKVIGVSDYFIGSRGAHGTAVAILDRDYVWKGESGDDPSLGWFPYRPEAIEQTLVNVPITSVEGAEGRFLTKWPNFEHYLHLFAAHDYGHPLPGLEGIGPMIRPFQSADGDLYFLMNGYLYMSAVQQLSSASPNTSVVVAEQYAGGKFDDVCYLVLSPSALAGTVEPTHDGK
jgi:hypothetical protein